MKNIRNILDRMFYNNENIISIYFSPIFNTENIIIMSYFFYKCKKLTSINIINFNTKNVRYFHEMLYG